MNFSLPYLTTCALLISVGGCSVPSARPLQAPDSTAERWEAPVAGAPPLGPPTPQPPARALPPPARCDAYRAHEASCIRTTAGLPELDAALAAPDPVSRDAALAAIQTCPSLKKGVALVLRAELGPPECADTMIGATLPAGLAPELSEALTAFVHAAHLERLVVKAPRLDPPFTKAEFADFSSRVLNDWIVTQAQAVYKIAQQGAKLSGYARGVVAVEAGLADLRFVSVVREVPLPEEMARDDELREAYYSELDMALTPWKDRGRDAALVGLKQFAESGVLVDAKIDRARALLSELYGGRRIDRLDGLILPELAPADVGEVSLRLAERVPTPWLRWVLPDIDVSDPRVLRALMERGIAAPTRADLASRNLEPAAAKLLARALIELGRLYWRSADFGEAEKLLSATDAASAGDAPLMLGLAQALKGGPSDAADMMLHGPRLPAGVGNVAALDRLSHQGGPLAATAAFDAAYLLQLVPPQGDPAFWRGLAQRYESAAHGLSAPRDQARAKELAEAARATARALD